MFTAPYQPLPDFVDRKEEMKLILGFIEKAQRSRGRLLIVRGEPGVGKTRLVQESTEQARSRGFAVGCGAGLSESIVPYQPWTDILRGLELKYILEELPPPKLLALYALVSDDIILAKVKLKDVDASALRTAETALAHIGIDSEESEEQVVKEGNLTIQVLKSHRLLILKDKKFSISALIEGREDEAFLADLQELLDDIQLKFGKAMRFRKSRSEAVAPIKALLSKLLEGGKYSGIDYTRDNPELRRSRLFDNVALGISRKSEIRPILIVMDDLQWTDPSSLDLLQYAVRNTRRHKVFILCTHRTEAGAVRPHLGTALQKIAKEELSAELDLTGLAREHLWDLATSFLGPHDLPANFLDQLWTETEGNPLFVREVLHRLEEEGAIQLKAKTKRLMRPVKELDLPERVREVIIARLKLLSKEDRELLDAAAICGGRFTASLVARVAGEEESKVLNGLNNIARIHGLLQRVGYDFAFNHSAVQEVVHEGLSKEARQTYHREAAEWLELAGGPIEDIAEHYYLARDKRALTMLCKAASIAQAKYANNEAIRLYSQALELEVDMERIYEILEEKGSVYGLMGEYDKALESYELALRLAKEDRKRGTILVGIGLSHYRKSKFEESMDAYTQALNLLKEYDCAAKSSALCGIGSIQYIHSEYDSALASYKEGLVIAESNEDQVVTCKAIDGIGNVYRDRGDYENALANYKKALTLGKKIGNHLEIARGLNSMAIVYTFMGDTDRALEYFEKSLNIKRMVGDPYSIGGTLNNIGLTYKEKGDYDRALECFNEGAQILERVGCREYIANIQTSIGNAYSEREECDLALKHHLLALSLKEKLGENKGIIISLLNIGNVYRLQGDFPQALKYYNKSIKMSEVAGERRARAHALCGIAEVYFDQRDLENAFDLSNQALSLSKEIGLKKMIADSKRVLGMIYREKMMWDKSIENFGESLRIFGDIGINKDLAQSHYEFGQMWKANGDSEKAKEHLRKALKIFERLKLDKRTSKVRKAIEEIRLNHDSK